ncbi:hypothetical protein K505DRAFT_416289 [Melanomma pulvis-pyrius CBS 109.77]|uniref:Uncharacterized protein n=1 Tax=Melanomma pulvis-pyrius CBS 109.77 TaxID=1314802 RepID=A0A6A6XH04_9PLEO|nr:hypothetical protein K505DRAFT_416289 [Melanomma pulvis-pyrius CBS 109.77]
MQCHRVRTALEKDPNSKWGFVIYRCTYGDDAAWEKFMCHLQMRTRLNLETYGESDLFSRIDWSVQQDPSLDEAGSDEVRERFARWVKEGGEKDYWLGTPRHRACIRVDKFLLETVLDGPKPEDFDSIGTGFVELVSLDEREGETYVGLSYLVPRIYILLNGPGWENFAVKDGVAIP